MLNQRYGYTLSLFVFTSAIFPQVVFAQGPELPNRPGQINLNRESATTDNADEEILLRGPLHEAFAAPVDYDPKPGLVVPQEPPKPINEIPAEVKPEGEVIWIPGYWAWDDDKEDFIWISGVYRKVPHKRRWVPGYWSQVEDGHQWTQGFWAPVETVELEYLPAPPESLEQGPSSPSPSDDQFWVSGNWVYQNNTYAWQPGYWSPGYEDWCWVPHCYTWTPGGYVYVPGYWDYQLADRGACYAPVYYRTPIYQRAGYYFWPQTLLNLSWLHVHLFVRPRYRHYYYGDWYGRYPRYGLQAVYDYHGRYGYAPIWNYVAWHFRRRGIDYGNRIRGWHRYYRDHQDYRPRHNYRDQQDFIASNKNYKHLRQLVLADDARSIRTGTNRRYQRVSQIQREKFRDRSRDFDKITQVRQQERNRLPVARRDQVPGSNPLRKDFSNRLKLPDTNRVSQVRRDIEREQTRRQNRSAFADTRSQPQFNDYRSRVRSYNEQQDRARNLIRRDGFRQTPSQQPQIRRGIQNFNRSQTRTRAQSPDGNRSRPNFRTFHSNGSRPSSRIEQNFGNRSNPYSPSRNRSFNRSGNRSGGSSFNRSFNRSGNNSFGRSRGSSMNRSFNRSFGRSGNRGSFRGSFKGGRFGGSRGLGR